MERITRVSIVEWVRWVYCTGDFFAMTLGGWSR